VSFAKLTLFKMSLLGQLDINQEIITSPTCSTLHEVREILMTLLLKHLTV